MTAPSAPIHADKPSHFNGLWLVVLAAAAAYAGSFSCPFIFDDSPAIIDNATIRDLGKISVVLSPPLNAAGATGRPLVNLTLAVNYAFGRLDVRGYHAVNLGLHIFAALVLFGVVRRTLERSRFREKSDEGRILTNSATAFAIALIWAVHPLLTESVVCVIQRNELLCGLFYLLTLYCFIRANEVERVVSNALGRGVWYGLSVLCCLLGMASKEVMVSAPIIVLLYDRTFVSGSFRSAWSQRKGYYLGLAATWLLLAWLILGEHGRRQLGIGLGLGVSAWDYLLTQCRAIVIYLKLCIWPHPLIVDYGDSVVRRLSDVLLPAIGICVLFAATVVGVWKRRAWGFLGTWFFLILAPSSSVVPVITQTIAEHRMYLPLAAVVTLFVLMLQRLLGRLALPALLALAAVFGWLTFQRTETYRTKIGIWSDTVAHCPKSERAHQNLGVALADAGRTAESITEYEAVLRLDPDYAEAHYNLGNALSDEHRTAEAIAQYEEALRLKPNYPEAHNNLGLALSAEGRTIEAIAQYEQALRLKSDYADARNNLANALSAEGRITDAIAQYEQALRLKPDIAAIHFNLAVALLKVPSRIDEVVMHLKAVLRLQPDNEQARKILARLEPIEP